MWLGDDFHHNGAFRLSYAFEYAAMMESGKDVQPFQFDRYDTFDWYLDLGPLANANRQYLHEKIPTWNDFVAHPDYDAFWKRQTMVPHLRSVKVPTLNVAGWWDQEDFYGPLAIYEALEKHDTGGLNYLVVGPWNHGGWTRAGDSLGPIGFGSDTAAYFRDQVQAPFFASFLKDKGTRDFPEALTFEPGIEPVAEVGELAAEAGRRPRCTSARVNVSTSGGPPSGAGNRESAAGQRSGAASAGLRRARPISTSSCPTRCIRFRTGIGRFRPPTSPAGRNGRPGSWKTSASSTTGRTCSSWETRAAEAGCDARRRGGGAPVCIHDRQRRGLDREADRRLPRGSTRRTGTSPATS